MAEAKKCDRCGVLYEKCGKSGKAVEIRIIEYTSSMGEKRKDLCPSCQTQLEGWYIHEGELEKEIQTHSYIR